MYLDDRTDESTQLEDGEKADVDFIKHLLAVLRVGHREHVTRRINSTSNEPVSARDQSDQEEREARGQSSRREEEEHDGQDGGEKGSAEGDPLNERFGSDHRRPATSRQRAEGLEKRHHAREDGHDADAGDLQVDERHHQLVGVVRNLVDERAKDERPQRRRLLVGSTGRGRGR